MFNIVIKNILKKKQQNILYFVYEILMNIKYTGRYL